VTSLNTISLAVFVDRAPFVRTVRCRTVANTLSIGFDVRRWSQCSAGKSKNASSDSRSFVRQAAVFSYLPPYLSANIKQADCEIITGAVLPADFATFWNQAGEKGFRPKVASIGKAVLFPEAVRALGRTGNNLSKEVWWSPNHPFKSSLNGMSAKQVARAYQQATGKQWTQPIGFTHALFEVAIDAMKRARSVADPKAIVNAIQSTKLETLVGQIHWDGKNLPSFAQKNIAKTPLVGGQWRLRDGSRYDIVIVDNKTAPQIPIAGKVEPIA
jgi:branched-chain amino acid transport system substrate-binding protein